MGKARIRVSNNEQVHSYDNNLFKPIAICIWSLKTFYLGGGGGDGGWGTIFLPR